MCVERRTYACLREGDDAPVEEDEGGGLSQREHLPSQCRPLGTAEVKAAVSYLRTYVLTLACHLLRTCRSSAGW